MRRAAFRRHARLHVRRSRALDEAAAIVRAIPAGLAARVDVTMKQAFQMALCRDRVLYVGEIVAMVLDDSPARAEDGRDRRRGLRAAARHQRRRGAADATPVLQPDGKQRRRPLPHRLRRLPMARSGRPTCVCASVRDPAVRRHAARDARRGGAVGRAADGTLTTWNGTQVLHFVQQGLMAASPTAHRCA